jgi:hypothetical protein
LPRGGAVIVYESIIDADRCENVFGFLMSLKMLIETQGGVDHTAAECAEWMRQAGFKSHAPSTRWTGEHGRGDQIDRRR